jgi:hypothetical protein
VQTGGIKVKQCRSESGKFTAGRGERATGNSRPASQAVACARQAGAEAISE